MCLKRLISSERGYSLAEVLVVAAALATTAAGIMAVLMPEVRQLYQKAVGTLTGILGSGF